MFRIRKSVLEDMPVLLTIYARARQFMKEQGNESQWGLPSPGKKLWPSEEALEANIAAGTQYVLELCSEDGAECAFGAAPASIVATFCYTHGHDPLYDTIYDGAWPDNDDYGVLHMMASAGTMRGVGQAIFAWTLEQCPTLRIDTHPNNKPMRALLEKSGFAYCGKVDMYSVQNDDVTRVCYIKKSLFSHGSKSAAEYKPQKARRHDSLTRTAVCMEKAVDGTGTVKPRPRATRSRASRIP